MPVYESGRPVGWTLDLMRRNTEPRTSHGVMEFLIATAARTFQEEGARFVSLSGAPLARLDRGEQPGAMQRVLDTFANAMEPVYGFRSLLQFKDKFHPVYQPLYLAYPDPAAIGSIATAIGRAYLPDLTSRQALRLLTKLRWPHQRAVKGPAAHHATPGMAAPRPLPGHGVAGPVGQRVDVFRLVDVARRGREGGVGPEPDHHTVLLARYALDLPKLGRGHLLAGHQVDDLAQHVDRLVEVLLDSGVTVDLKVGKRPFLVQHANAGLGAPSHGAHLGPGSHGGDQHVVTVHDVVHDRHGGPVVLAVVPEYAGPVGTNELPAFGSIQGSPLRIDQ
jgi:hypothetical protein